MKRTLLTVISVCLVLAGIFGIYAGKVGTDDVSAIVRYTNNQRSFISDIAAETEKGIDMLEKEEEQRRQDILDATENTLVDQIGSEQLEEGEKQYAEGKEQYDSGKAQYDSGKAQYDAAKAQYDEKYAQYENACTQLDAARAQLEDAKAQRDAGQKALDQATPAYNAIKSYINLADGKVYEYTKYLADPIAQTFGYSSAEAVVKAYEDSQAQLAAANVQIAEAERGIADAEAQLASAKTQLDDGKKQLDAAKARLDSSKAQLDAGKAQLDASRAELDAGHEAVNASVEELESALEALKAYDDAETKVKAGIARLMSTPAIAEKVVDESDYRSVIEATEQFIDENKDSVNSEMTVRQSLYTLLIIAALVCLIVGVLGVIAALVPTLTLLDVAAFSAVGAAALSAGFTAYGLLNGSRSFSFSYMDSLGNVAGDGGLQNTALIILTVVAICTAVVALSCRSTYRGVLFGVTGTADSNEDEAVEAEPVPEPTPEPAPKSKSKSKSKAKSKAAPAKDNAAKAKSAPTENNTANGGMSIEELNAETLRLTEEAKRMEETAAQLEALKKAQEEYEEARRRFEAARNSGK